MTCLGRCHENSAFHINGKNYSGDALSNLNTIIPIAIGTETELNQDNYNVKANGKEILTKAFTNITDYYKPF